MTDSVAVPSKHSLRGDARLKKIRDLRGGVVAMRKAGETYLPKEEREEQSDYDDRLARSWLFPALDKAIEDVADRIFSKDVSLSADVPTDLAELAEDIDNQGRNLNSFARDVLEDGTEAGIAFILVDSPPKQGDLTLAQARAINFRPYLVHIKAEDILGWKTTKIGNKSVLSMVRIWETVEENDPDDKFKEVTVPQVRVLELPVKNGVVGNVVVSVYRENKDGKWELRDRPIQSGLQEITLVPFYTNRTGFMKGKPRYEKLADLNIAHWQSASDQRNILHKARVPLLALFGFSVEDVTSSPNSALVTTKSPQEADGKWVEIEGASIEAGRNDLKDLEQRMTVLGIELAWKPVSNNTGATGAAIDHGKMVTPLAMIAASLQDALNKAFGFMAKYKGTEMSGGVEVNRDFGASLLGTGDLVFLLNAVNTGQISQETFLKECARRGVLISDLNIEDEIERIKDEAPETVSLPGIDED